MPSPPLPSPPLPSPPPSLVPPYAPTGLTVTGVTTTSFQLTWTNPFDGNSDLSNATVTVNGSTTLQADTLTSHQFEELVPNRAYQIEVVVSNAVGPSPPGSTFTRTLPLGETPTPKQAHSDTDERTPIVSCFQTVHLCICKHCPSRLPLPYSRCPWKPLQCDNRNLCIQIGLIPLWLGVHT